LNETRSHGLKHYATHDCCKQATTLKMPPEFFVLICATTPLLYEFFDF
jgi:hypothetical protein